jgi:hypothetical protein
MVLLQVDTESNVTQESLLVVAVVNGDINFRPIAQNITEDTALANTTLEDR